MSVQFRSRIKSVVDYSKVLNGIGICCDRDGNKTIKTFHDCFNDGGNYFPGDVPNDLTCPPVDTEKGCCCACSFVENLSLLSYPWNFATNQPTGNQYYDSGVICNISKCECERLNGKFTSSSEESIQLTSTNFNEFCVKPAPEFGTNYMIDARYPRACCNLQRDPITGWPTNLVCDNVCVKPDCSSLGTIDNPAVYNDKTVCGNNLYLDAGTPAGQEVCNTPFKIARIVNKTTTYANDDVYGSCYEITTKNLNSIEYDCTVKIKTNCDGYWVEKTESYCNDKYTPSDPVKVNNLYDVQKMTSSEFENLNLTIGDEYQGGIYIGVYEPGPPINATGSVLFGNLNFDSPGKFIPTDLGVGGPHKKWAIIVNPKTYTLSFLNDSENDVYYKTSLWDGYYNIYGDMKTFNGIQTIVTNSIRYKNRGGFIDYYIPSIYELYFYWNYLSIYSIKPYSGPESGYYLTSSLFNTNSINKNTNKTQINNKGMVYCGLSLPPTHMYKTILLDKKTKTNMNLFRKIVIED